MAIKTVIFLASPNGVTPSVPQDAGVQGDHRATEVVFRLDPALISTRYRYRWEFMDGNGRYDTTETFSMAAEQTETAAPLLGAWTRAGGAAEIRLIITDPGESGTEEPVTLYTLAGRLRFQGRDGAALQEQEIKRGLTALIDETKSAAEEAETQAAAANTAATNADSMARFADSAGQQAAAAAANANAAALTATQKAADADTAAALAETATGNANSAAQAATDRAAVADTAAQQANTAAQNAAAATEAANTAANSANTAAAAANAAAERADGMVDRYDRVIPYAEGTQTTAKVISAPVEPAAERTAGLCVRVKMPAAFDETFYLAVSTWSAPIAAEESVTGYTPVWPAGIYTFTYDGTAWRLPLPMAASTAYTDTALSDHDHTIRRRYSPALHGTAAGEAVHITDSAAESDFSRLAVIGRSTQDGEPAPDTPIAIAGVQPASVRVCRKNLANIPDKTVSNAAYVGFSDVYSKNAPGVMHMVDKSKIYTLSAYIDNTSGAADSGVKVWYTKNGTVSVFNPVSSVSVPVGSKGAATYVIDLTALNWEGVTGLFPGLDLRGSGEGKTVSASQVQFEAGDAATPYAPYAGTDYPLTLTTPMYSLPGGADEIDLVSGAETRRCGVITLDGTETWMVRKANATSASFSTPVSNVAIGAAYPAISTIGFRAGRYGVDGYEGTTSDSGTSNRPQISVLYSRIGSSAEDTDADKISKFKAWLASHPVTLVYQLANPVTADHARADIAQPTPEANVSADGAPVDVTYSRDLQTVIDTLSAAITA